MDHQPGPPQSDLGLRKAVGRKATLVGQTAPTHLLRSTGKPEDPIPRTQPTTG